MKELFHKSDMFKQMKYNERRILNCDARGTLVTLIARCAESKEGVKWKIGDKIRFFDIESSKKCRYQIEFE